MSHHINANPRSIVKQALPTALQLDLQGELRSCIIAQGDFHLLNTSHDDDIDEFNHDNTPLDMDRLLGGGNFEGQDGAFDQVEAGEAFAQRYRQGLGSAPGIGLGAFDQVEAGEAFAQRYRQGLGSAPGIGLGPGLGPLSPSIEEVTAANTALNAASLPRNHQGDVVVGLPVNLLTPSVLTHHHAISHTIYPLTPPLSIFPLTPR